MILLAWVAATHGQTPIVAALFHGIQPAVLVVVARALAGAAFLGIWALGLPFPLIVGLAALAGLLLPAPPAGQASGPVPHALRHSVLTVAAFGAVIAAVYLATRWQYGADPYDGVATLFMLAAAVTFGGACAVLPYVADRAVETYGWLSAAEMLNGPAVAEATPGPLILVNVYAGKFAGIDTGTGALTAILACFYTFAPSFMLILVAAPYVARMQRAQWARQALAGVSARVVDVVLNLTVYLGEVALFPAGWTAPDWPRIGLLAVFALLAIWRRTSMLWLVGLGAAAGVALWALGLVGP